MSGKPVQKKAHPYGRWKAHLYADLFPLLEGEAFDSFVADIRVNGLRYPITTYQRQILDGRNRFRACQIAGIPPRFIEYDGKDPLAFVMSANLQRRDLDPSQRAMVAAKLETLRHGGDRKDQDANLHLDRKTLALQLNVSPRSVADAASVRAHATPELVKAVERGHISVSVAAPLAAAPVALQRQAVADPARAHTIAKQQRRTEREVELAAKIVALPTIKAGAIYADCEWRDEVWSRETGLDRAADNHYSTSEVDTLKARKALIDEIAADDCVLFHWSTIQHEKIAHEVMAAWGFEYKSQIIWVKPSPGMGRWVRSLHEILLIGTRGNPPCPAPGDQFPSVIEAPRPGPHSKKPDIFYELIESYFPTVPKIELNARGKARPGWAVWGNEAESEDEDAA
jgi:N6-adenosine-specific RNA methylase IME4